MAGFHKLVDMKHSPEEKAEEMAEASMPMMPSYDYPPGLSIYIGDDELEKLDLDEDVEAGDMIHGFFLARATSVSEREVNGKKCRRVEMQITHLGIEDESLETEPDDEEEEAEEE